MNELRKEGGKESDVGWDGLDEMHTCLHAGETAPEGK